MTLRERIEDLRVGAGADVHVPLPSGGVATVAPTRFQIFDRGLLAIVRDGGRRRLLVVEIGSSELCARFEGETWKIEDDVTAAVCDLEHRNAVVVGDVCEAARPQPLGLDDSFGLGDRLGIAGPAHLRALRDSGFKVVLAQQSIRELERTERTPDDVMDAAVWAVIEEGWPDVWGADADHLKTPADVDLMAAAGFTMFTIDPGDHVVDGADTMSMAELEEAASALPWSKLDDTASNAVDRYKGRTIRIGSDLVLEPSDEGIMRAWVKYGASLAHTAAMFRHIETTMGERPFEVEVSVDETAAVTTPFEHWLVALELRRLGVRWMGLAPRFIGDFEKGVDYRGDLEVFRLEYLKHLAVAEALGPYKISIHSGSDKFGVYRVIGEMGRGGVHVKTAGTSYLEALRTIAAREPELFREILDFSRSLYQDERRTYHVSGRLERVPESASIDHEALVEILEDDDARQVLHVTFGRVLTDRRADGEYLFKGRLLAALETHEDEHFNNLEAHFRRHTAPFGAGGDTA
jgi:hypothetical protein